MIAFKWRLSGLLFFLCVFVVSWGNADSSWIGPRDITSISNHGLNPIVTPVEALDGHPVGDRHNSYPWSMAWFQGKLYVGTNRDFFCLMAAFLEQAGAGAEYPPSIPDLECTEDIMDLDLWGEIWEYTPQTETWKMVYKSPTIQVLQDDGSIAETGRDAGYRSMTIMVDENGTEWLYVLGYSSQTLDDVPPPRLLRTNADLLANADIDMKFEDIAPPKLADPTITTARGLEVFQNRLFLSYNYDEGTDPDTDQRLVGAGVLMFDEISGDFIEVSARPLGGNFYNVGAFELAVYNNYLWVGTFNPVYGYEVLRSDCVGEPPWDFEQVVTNGAYRPIDEERNVLSESVVSMYPFNGSLYVGSGTLFGGNDVVFENGPAPAELIRINADDSWDLVCGQPRRTPDGLKLPISGMGPGFGNQFTGYIWRMMVHDGWLYVGTMDNSYILQYGDPSDVPDGLSPEQLELLVQLEAGFDLWKTFDGRHWFQLTRTGLGDPLAVGVRTMMSSEHGLFIGGADPYYGCRTWLGTPDGGAARLPQPVMDLQAISVKDTRTRLEWSPSDGANKYRVMRAQRIKTADGLPLAFSEYEEIALIDATGYTDTTVRIGEQYHFYVQAVDSSGYASDASNVVSVGLTFPDFALPVVLSSFIGEVQDGQVSLRWETISEWQNLGFNVYRSDTPDGQFTKLNQQLIPGLGTLASGREYHWVDDAVSAEETSLYYYIEDVGLDGWTHQSNVISVLFTDARTATLPTKTQLFQNYPNAFNPETWIPYQLDRTADVEIRIYNLQGHLLRTLALGSQPAGYYLDRSRAAHWDGRNDDGEYVTSGTYFYRFQAGDFTATRKMLLVK